MKEPDIVGEKISPIPQVLYHDHLSSGGQDLPELPEEFDPLLTIPYFMGRKY